MLRFNCRRLRTASLRRLNAWIAARRRRSKRDARRAKMASRVRRCATATRRHARKREPAPTSPVRRTATRSLQVRIAAPVTRRTPVASARRCARRRSQRSAQAANAAAAVRRPNRRKRSRAWAFSTASTNQAAMRLCKRPWSKTDRNTATASSKNLRLEHHANQCRSKSLSIESSLCCCIALKVRQLAAASDAARAHVRSARRNLDLVATAVPTSRRSARATDNSPHAWRMYALTMAFTRVRVAMKIWASSHSRKRRCT
mmetsp:Transcript_38101/g.109555  ORF Transcript_38101/g.109555 Transcript_38101/m.109555 type:complete len:259 (+) Transcript_38101:223-999(+)